MNCERCKEKTTSFKMSFFNTDMLCKKCETTEQEHSQYTKAREVELAELQKGNYNFRGIGLPDDLKKLK